MKVSENYLLKDFKNHGADLLPVLVDTCSFENCRTLYIFLNLFDSN